jgi:3-hydroxyisobutyrate dehydrogenase
MADKPRLGFVGIGLMGEAMTRRLLDRGYRMTVWNREPERLKTVVPHGAVAAASPAAVTAASDFVLICVLNTEAVESCVFAKSGVVETARSDQILIDLSTADPAATRRMAERLRRASGMRWIDAPVSGGPPAARAGTMTVMAGGDPADIAAIADLMKDMAGNFTHMGPVGAGQTTKIINQTIVGAGFVLMAEAVALAKASGIDAKRLPACLSGGFADSALLQRIYPQMLERRFDPPLSYARQLLKDLKAVKEFAHGLGLELPLVAAATERYVEHCVSGGEMRDSASIVDLYSGP